MRITIARLCVALVVACGCGDGDDGRAHPTPTTTPSATTTPTATATVTVKPTPGADPPCSWDGIECQGGCFTGRCIYDQSVNRCVCPFAFDVDCGSFPPGGCAGSACFAPGQTCIPVSDFGCLCVFDDSQ